MTNITVLCQIVIMKDLQHREDTSLYVQIKPRLVLLLRQETRP